MKKFRILIFCTFLSAISSTAFSQGCSKREHLDFDTVIVASGDLTIAQDGIYVQVEENWLPVKSVERIESDSYQCKVAEASFYWACPSCGYKNNFWKKSCESCGYDPAKARGSK